MNYNVSSDAVVYGMVQESGLNEIHVFMKASYYPCGA